MFYLCSTLNYTFRVIGKVYIFIYMDEGEYSEELINLLKRLQKGYTWGANLVLNLSDAERDIFMEASDKANKIRKKEFADIIKGRD